MDNQLMNNGTLPTKVKVFGTLFLFAQLLFAINNYGPHELPVLNLVFDEPWISAEETSGNDLPMEVAQAFTFEDIAERAGLNNFKRAKVNGSNPSYLEVMAGGLAVADVDGDGYEDIFFISMPSFEEHSDEAVSPSSLYKNRGDSTFKDITKEMGLSDINGYAQGALFFDYNNDGRQDLYIASYDGDLRFDYATNYSGLNPSRRSSGWGIEFADFNHSGHLDLVMAAGPVWDINPADTENLFFRNQGNDQFEDVTHSTEGLHSSIS